jgi:Tfp pilus assembly protein PilF
MNKKHIALSLLIPLSLGLIGCSSMLTNHQLQFGIQAAQKELWDEAIFRWKKAIELDPQSAAALNNLAVAFEKKGQWEEAGKAYEAALKQSPNNKYIKSNFQSFKDRLDAKEKEETDNKKNEKK